MRISKLVAPLLLGFSLMSCGGGGGGGGNNPFFPANVGIDVDPSKIDTGDRANVVVRIGDVHEKGIVLKVRFPTNLIYIPNTVFLKIDEEPEHRDPDETGTSTTDSKFYMVFVMSQSEFGDPNYGELSFTVQGVTAVADARLEVDADIIDRTADEDFSIATPKFTADDDVSLKVVE